MSPESKDLVYFIAETHSFAQKSSVLVVTLIGPLIKRNTPVFRECIEEVLRTKSTFVVLNFRDVPDEVDPGFLSVLADLRASFLSGGIVLKLSGLHPRLRGVFVDAGVASEADFTDNLASALEVVAALKKKAA